MMSAEIFTGLWVMPPGPLQILRDTVAAVDMAAMTRREIAGPPIMRMDGNTAVVNIGGVLMRDVPWIFRALGISATSYGDIAQAVETAAADPSVDRIVLLVNSPGGRVGGETEAADAIYAARQAKPVVAHVQDIGASAAYWLASQASRITASPTAEVGSIGVVSVIPDLSAAAERQGIKIHVIRSGEHKGTGVPGAEVTPEQLVPYQEAVDGIHEQFVQAVARGRGMTTLAVSAIATGRTWIAPAASKLRIIDAIGTDAAAIASTTPRRIKVEVVPVAEVEADDPEIEAQAEAEAQDPPKWAVDLMAQVENLTGTVATLKARVDPAPSEGADPVHNQGNGGIVGSGADFVERYRQMAAELNISRTEAQRLLMAQEPELYERYRASLRV